MLERYWKLLAICSVLWTAAFLLGVGGTLRNDVRVLFWAGMVSLGACMTTAWLVAIGAACRAVHDERLDVEHLISIAAGAMEDERRVPHIH